MTRAAYPRIVAISDRAQLSVEQLVQRARRATEPTLSMVRDKDLPFAQRAAQVRELGAALRDSGQHVGAVLSRLDELEPTLALLADAHGASLHLPQALATPSLLAALRHRPAAASLWISSAWHDPSALPQVAADLDALWLSPIFESPGKGRPLGLEALRRARAQLEPMTPRPALVALGGVTHQRIAACLDAGADSVASIRAQLGNTS